MTLAGQNRGHKKKHMWMAAAGLCLSGAVLCAAAVGCGLADADRVEGELQSLAQSTNVTPTPAGSTAVPRPLEEPSPEVPADTDEGLTALEKDLVFLEESGIPVPEKEIDFADLMENTNKDIYAWIYVPGTQVDYPVLRHPEDNSYYLDYNIDGTKGYPGCIYTEDYNAMDFTDFNTVLYGHNMKNGTGFGSLHKFEDAEFFEENRYVYVYTQERLLAYEIFGAYEFSNIHLLAGYDAESAWGISTYLKEVEEVRGMKCNRKDEIFPDEQDHIITLSTCVSGNKQKRYLVQGVLLNEMTLEETGDMTE